MRIRYLIQHVGSQVEFGMQVVFSSLGGMILTLPRLYSFSLKSKRFVIEVIVRSRLCAFGEALTLL
jgi:hypothetical protein